MKGVRAPHDFISEWLHHPHAITVVSFAIAGAFLAIASWLIVRNLRHNEPGLRAPFSLPFALIVAGACGGHRTRRRNLPLETAA